MHRYDLRSTCGCQTELDPWSDGDWVRHDDAQAEIARLTAENDNLRQIERNVQAASEHEHQRAERALADLEWLKRSIFGSANYHPSLAVGNFAEMAQITEAARQGSLDRAEAAEAELARLREQMKDREYD